MYPSITKRNGFLIFALVFIGLLQAVWGEGFRNSAPGAYALGQSGGRNAFIDDATAALHNPANLMDLNGESSVLFSPTIVHIESEFQVEGGNRGQTEEPFKLLPSFFAVSPLVADRLVFGLSVTVPYGLATKWEEAGAFGPGGELRYFAPYESEMLTMQFNPVVAFRVHDNLSLALGLSAIYSELRFKQYFPKGPIPAPAPPLVANETVAEAEMDGWGFGANFALSWDLSERDRLAISLRSETTIDHDGDSRIGSLTPDALSFGFTERGSAETRITYPWIAGIAYGRKLTDKLLLELQYERVGFSDFEELNIDLANNNQLFGGANITRQDWEDSHTLGIGLRYDHGNGLRTHASGQFFRSPVPDDTLNTTIPDANQLAYTIGLTKRWDHAYFGLAYSYVDYEKRRSEIGDVVGKLHTNLHLLAINAGWNF